MKILIVIYAILFTTSVFAAKKGYDLNMELSVNGKKLSSPRFIFEEGKTGLITQKLGSEKIFLEVVATESEVKENKGILMKFKVGYLKNDGTRTMVSKPTILSKAGQQTSFTVGNDSGKDIINLNVVANRKTL